MKKNHDDSKSTGTHPVGTALGAAGGAVAGAVVGTAVGGPIGTVVGGAIGAVTGALAGHSAAEAVDPTVEDAYWSANCLELDYVERTRPYTDYGPAFRYGWESARPFGRLALRRRRERARKRLGPGQG